VFFAPTRFMRILTAINCIRLPEAFTIRDSGTPEKTAESSVLSDAWQALNLTDSEAVHISKLLPRANDAS
jgi:hypothetical protein